MQKGLRAARRNKLLPLLLCGALAAWDGAARSAPPGGPSPGATLQIVTADPPVPRPHTRPCVVQLFTDLQFADFSPKTFAYAPPPGCSGPWAKVVFEADFFVTAGRQFDRTAHIWIGGTNVYFGTTAEPSGAVSPSWHVERDLTDYSALLAAAHPGEVDLGNLVNGTYTGVIHGSADLQFYPAEPSGGPDEAQRPADVVLPLAAGPSGGTVALNDPTSALSQSFVLPTNIERAYLDVYAQSQSADEFWYTCVPSDLADELQSCPGTGFREVEITLDGQPAGVAPVFPWIYTGGIDPYLWRPLPGVQTLDFVPYRVDLTPFAGVLSDGRSHQVALRVWNADNYFSATATLLLYLDRGAANVTGAVTTNTLGAGPVPVVTADLHTSGGTTSGTVEVRAARRFTIAGYVQTSHGRVETEVAADLGFLNRQRFTISASAYVQDLAQSTTVLSMVTVADRRGKRTAYEKRAYPLAVDLAVALNPDGSGSQTTRVRQGYDVDRIAARDGGPGSASFVSNVVAPQDTLLFDATGAITGQSGQKSVQRYVQQDSGGRCYSRQLTAQGGVLTGDGPGEGCWPL